ncbi:MAG: response regulator [Prochlorotrichaceae cyanobacterium]|jgi:CheY-like chemotaxis protein
MSSPETIAILLVEDDTVNGQLFQMMLERLGYQVDLAENGQEALNKLSRKSYRLILMDCQMPILDGYATTQALRSQDQYRDLIIIGLTAYAMTEDRERCLEVGMNDYLTKPLKMADLSTTLQKWLA